MNSKFTPVDCDDVIMLERETFKVSRLKQLVKEGIKNKLSNYIYDSQNNQRTHYNVNTLFTGIAVIGEYINFSNIQFNSVKECQILKIGGRWQKGKLKMNIHISPNGNNLDPVTLEFYPDTSNEQESPLGDIGKLLEKSRVEIAHPTVKSQVS